MSAIFSGPSSAVPIWRAVLRFVLTVAIFAVLEPVIGSAITIAGFIALRVHIGSFDKAGLAIPALIAYGLWLGYPIRFLVGAGVGAIVALRDRFGGARLAEAAIVGVAAGVIWATFFAKAREQGLFTYLVIGAALVATALSWKATRWLRVFG